MSLDLGLGIFYWLRLAGLAALLGLTIVLAWRRWHGAEPDHQAKRILFPWLAFILGCGVYVGLFSIFLAPYFIFLVAATVAIWVTIPAIITVVAVDLGGRLLGAERTGFWLGAGIVAYGAITFIWLGWLTGGALQFIPGFWLEYLAILSIPTTAAISWWSYLPGGGGGGDAISKAFD